MPYNEPHMKIKHKFSVLSSFFQLFHSSSVMASLNSQNKHLTHIMQFGFCSFDFPKSWLSSHFQLLSLCNLKCETSGPKGERRWNSQKEEEKVFASKYNLYYKPSGSPLLWGLSLKLVLYMNKVENQLIAIKRENTSTATEERWKVQSLSRLQKREWIRARSQTVVKWNPFVQTNYCVGKIKYNVGK